MLLGMCFATAGHARTFVAAPSPSATLAASVGPTSHAIRPTRTAAKKLPRISTLVGGSPSASTCDDGDPCTQVDLCRDDRCLGTEPVVCLAPNQCREDGICRSIAGVCTNPQKPDGTPCDDAAFCTVEHVCRAGECQGGRLRDCADDNACTEDFCDEEMDACVNNLISPCCGNGIVEGEEECDDGRANADAANATCRNRCTVQRCGDRIVDDRFGEVCDLGPTVSDAPNASCRTDCQPKRCGDGIVDDQSGEQCDDGNSATGDGCSPRCFLEPPAHAARLGGTGNPHTECIIAWRIEGVPLHDASGTPPSRQTCTDGDATCDHDRTANAECRFHVWLCSNNTVADQPCRPGTGRDGVGTVSIAEVRKPTARRAARRDSDAHNHSELMVAASAAAVGNNVDVCGPRLVIRVPLKVPGRRGSRWIRVRATTNRNVRDADTLKLVCMPSRTGGAANTPRPTVDLDPAGGHPEPPGP